MSAKCPVRPVRPMSVRPMSAFLGHVRPNWQPWVEHEVVPNLRDYTTIATNDDIVTALKEGLRDVQRMINSLNMAPNPQASARNKVWFQKPWVSERLDKHSFAYAAGLKPIRGEDGDMEVLREDLRQITQEQEQSAEQVSLKLWYLRMWKTRSSTTAFLHSLS